MGNYSIAGFELSNPLISAAGTINGTDKDAMLHDVANLCQTEIGALTVGSFTVNPQDGNEALYGSTVNNFNHRTGTMYYADGMPNIGSVAARLLMPTIVETAHDAGKTVIASISPTTVNKENGTIYKQTDQLAYQMMASGVDLVEVNLSHQVVRSEGSEVRVENVLGYDLDSVCEIINTLQSSISDIGRVGLKLPPYIEQSQLQTKSQIAQYIVNTDNFGFISTAGAVTGWVPRRKNGTFLLTGAPDGIGAKSGPITKAIGFGELNNWKKALKDTQIDVISMLGVSTGAEIARRLEHGASAVGIVSSMYGLQADHKKAAIKRMIADWRAI